MKAYMPLMGFSPGYLPSLLPATSTVVKPRASPGTRGKQKTDRPSARRSIAALPKETRGQTLHKRMEEVSLL